MANVCWQCGDVGLSEALLYCSKCKISLRHSYCIDEALKNVAGEIIWLCEGCKVNSRNSLRNNKSPKYFNFRTRKWRSHRNKMRPKHPCQWIRCIKDRLVETQNRHSYPVRIGSNLNMDSHVSSDLHRKASSCSNDGLGVASLRLKEDKRDECAKEMTKRRRLVLLDEFEMEDSNPLINGQVSNFKSAVKKVPVKSVDASDRQTKGETEAQKSEEYVKGKPKRSILIPPGFKLAVPEAQKYVKEKPRLILPEKDESVNLQSVTDCEGTSVQVTDESLPFNSIEDSDRLATNQIAFEKSQIKFSCQQALHLMTVEECMKQQPNRIPTQRRKHDLDNSCHLIDDQGTHFQGAVKRFPNSSIETTERQSIGHTNTHKSQTNFSCQAMLPSKPAISHVWRGHFNISNVELGPFRAHLSSKACKIVCDVARNLPSILHMQKLRRLDAWPDSFKVSSPTDDNIALYFFPGSDRVEAVLDGLVDNIINNDLMLRFQFDEIELLVFSSFVLPYKHKTFLGKYYAWGVFKPRSIQVCSVPAALKTARERGKNLRETKEGLIPNNGEYSDDARHLVEQRSELKRPAGDKKHAEDKQETSVSEKTESPKISEETEEGMILYDDFVGISGNSKPTSLDLLPMHVEDIPISVKFRTNENAIDLKLGLGISSFGNQNSVQNCKGSWC